MHRSHEVRRNSIGRGGSVQRQRSLTVCDLYSFACVILKIMMREATRKIANCGLSYRMKDDMVVRMRFSDQSYHIKSKQYICAL